MSARVRNVGQIGKSRNAKPIPIIHFIPPKFNLVYKIEVVTSTETIDVTDLLVDGTFTDGVTSTIGNFDFKILDPSNTNTLKISEYDTINLYADYGITATTLKFSGKIERKTNTEYTFLELSGRSVAINTTGVNVTYSSDGLKARSVIITEIVDKYFSGVISTANIEEDLDTMEANYEEVPFWEVVEEICTDGGRDAYISSSLVMNYFLIGSRKSTTEAIVEDRNLINPIDFAKDTEEVVTKVRIYGQKIDGIPLIATSSSDTSVTQGIEKIKKIDNSNVSNLVQAQALADSEYEKSKVLPTLGSVQSLMLPTLTPGEQLRIVSPTNNIPPSYYEISSYSHIFFETDVPQTSVNIKKQRLNIPEILKKNIRFQTVTPENINPNEMDTSLIYSFDTNEGTFNNTQRSQISTSASGEYVLSTISGNSGTWESPVVELGANVSKLEFRISGDSLAGTPPEGTKIEYSLDGGVVYRTWVAETIEIPTGRDLKIRVSISSSETQVKSVAALYSLVS